MHDMPTFGCRDPAVAYEERKAAYAVIRRDNNVALVRSKTSGNYFLLGGGAWAGEAPEATVLREIAEELGCEGKGKGIQLWRSGMTPTRGRR